MPKDTTNSLFLTGPARCKLNRSTMRTLEPMSKHSLAAPMLVAAAVLALVVTSTLSAAPELRQQRVMLVQKHRFGAPSGTFEFYALTPGRLGFDSGKLMLAASERPYVVRDGQRAAVYVGVETLTGKRGRFDLRWRVEFVGAGDGATVGTGRWSLVRGTGVYAGVTGAGRLAMVVMTPRGFTSAQFEGLLRAVPPDSKIDSGS
jgi:hypothetical protein